MKRREFITLLGGAAAAWPLTARAQQTGKVARVGFLGATSAPGYANQLAGFRAGLRDFGYVEGTNVVIEYRWAQGYYERLPGLVADLVRSNVNVIVTHGTPAALAAKQATTTVPIVMAIVGDPVAGGIVASLAQPGGNITGQSFFNPELGAKKIELLKEGLPQMTRAACLLNQDNPGSTVLALQAMEVAAKSLKMELYQFAVRRPDDLEGAFERMEQARVEGLAIDDDGMLNSNVGAIAGLAIKRRILSSGNKELAHAGGLMGYGVNVFATFRRAAVFVDKVLKGAKPADLPIEQATTFEFVLNLKTANALGLAVPPTLLVRADEVIE
jgi:putative tryptophan/tyrosine transport system substrate-binding protein